jgi:hypothetical protein
MLSTSYNQVKPWGGGVPKLRRSHPFARKILNYIVDTGHGIFDLACPSDYLNSNAAMTGPDTAIVPPRTSGIRGPVTYWSGSFLNGGTIFDVDRTIPFSNLAALGAGAGFSFATSCVRYGDGSGGTPKAGTIFQSPVRANEGGEPFINWALSFDFATTGLIGCAVNTTSGGIQSHASISSGGTIAPNFAFTSIACSLVNDSAGSATGKLYVNGSQVGSTSAIGMSNSGFTGGGMGQDAENQIMLGSDFHVQTGVPAAELNGVVFYGATWSRGLSAGEIRLLHKYPWALIETGGLRPHLDF